MTDINDIAQQFFGDTAPKPVQQQQQPSAPALPDTPEGKELAQTTALYSEQSYRDVNLLDPTELLDKPLEEVTELNEQHRDDLWALQVSEPQANELTTLIRAAIKEPPTKEQQAAWHKETTERLVAQHGQEGARQRLELVQRYLARSPRLAKRIAEAGLLSHPRIAEEAHSIAWSQRAKGLL